MFSKLAIFATVALAAAQANLVLTPYTGSSCTGTAGPQAQIQTNVCDVSGSNSFKTTCSGGVVTENEYANTDCSGSPSGTGSFNVGQCVSLQGDPSYQSAKINSCS